MNKILKRLFTVLFIGSCGNGFASTEVHMESAQVNLDDMASLQRGAKLFMNYCASCHSAELMRYSRISKDLGLLDAGLTEEDIQNNLNFTGAKFGEPIKVAMSTQQGVDWFGAAPPDLSLTARAKHTGADWIYAYLKSFYIDEKRPSGWNNLILPNASMPHVLWELQGIQHAVYEQEGHSGQAKVVRLELTKPGTVSKNEYDQVVHDIANFMHYMSEPAALQRESTGMWVILFLAAFTFLAWLLKHEYWRDIH